MEVVCFVFVLFQLAEIITGGLVGIKRKSRGVSYLRYFLFQTSVVCCHWCVDMYVECYAKHIGRQPEICHH